MYNNTVYSKVCVLVNEIVLESHSRPPDKSFFFLLFHENELFVQFPIDHSAMLTHWSLSATFSKQSNCAPQNKKKAQHRHLKFKVQALFSLEKILSRKIRHEDEQRGLAFLYDQQLANCTTFEKKKSILLLTRTVTKICSCSPPSVQQRLAYQRGASPAVCASPCM